MNKLLGNHYYKSPLGSNNPLSQGFPPQNSYQGTKPTQKDHQTNQSYGFGRLPADDALDRFQKEQSLNRSHASNNSYYNASTEPYSPKQNNSNHYAPLPQNNSNLYSSQVNSKDVSPQLPKHSNQPNEVHSATVETKKPAHNIFQESRPLGMSNSSVTLRGGQAQFYGKGFDQTYKYETNTPDQLNKLSVDIITNQKTFEQRIEESMKKRPYNILTNQGSSSNRSAYQGMPYGYALKALIKSQEDAQLQKAMAAKGLEYQSPLVAKKKYGNESYRPIDYKETLRNQYGDSIIAGKNNYYGETEFRYANKTQMQDPLSQEQMYGIRALKNMSGMKIY